MDIIHGDALEVDMGTVCHEYVKKRDWEDGMNNNYVSLSDCDCIIIIPMGVVASPLPLDLVVDHVLSVDT